MGAPNEDPWAGDDVPVGSGLGDIVWDGIDHPEDPDDGGDSEPRQTPRPRFLAVADAVAGALAVVAVAGVAWSRADDDDAAVPTDTADDETPTTLGALPAPVTTPSTIATIDSVATESGGVVGPDETDLPIPANGEIAVPDRIAAVADTTVVALSNDGRLLILDLPSGTFTATDLGLPRTGRPDFGSEVLVAAPDAAMIATGEGNLVIVADDTVSNFNPANFSDDPSQPPTQVVPFGWIRDSNGDTAFVVITVDSATGGRSEFRVGVDGEVTPPVSRRDDRFSVPVFAQGTRFANDAGGAYRLDADGAAARISSGEILAASADRLLLRECDAQRACRTVLRDHDGDETGEVDLPVTFEPQFFGASLSPDAEALSYASQSFNGDRTLLDLSTGDSVVFDGQQLGPFGNSWSNDSAGEFSFGNVAGMTFLDRTSGDAVTYGDELGTIRALAVRPDDPAR